MSTTLTCSSTLEWRQGSGRQIITLKSSPPPSSPARSRHTSLESERAERVTLSNWRTPEARRPGEARQIAQRSADRDLRAGRLKNMFSEATYPAEEERKERYKQLKVHTNKAIDWLVETAHPSNDNLPSQIAFVPNPKYDYPRYPVADVNYLITLADDAVRSGRCAKLATSNNIALLDKVIHERSEYSFWMNQIATDEAASQEDYDAHQHFIDILEDVRELLSHHITKIPQRQNLTLGKRNRSPTKAVQRKAVKPTTESPASIATISVPTLRRINSCKANVSHVKKSWAAIAAIKV